MAAARKGNSNRMHHICNPVCYGDEFHDWGRKTRNQSTKDQSSHQATPRQLLNGRCNHHHYHTHTGKMGSRSHGRNSYNWARMKFKPAKSRCLVIKKGKVTQRFTLKIQGEQIQSIVNNPIKCLGKWYVHTEGRQQQQTARAWYNTEAG